MSKKGDRLIYYPIVENINITAVIYHSHWYKRLVAQQTSILRMCEVRSGLVMGEAELYKALNQRFKKQWFSDSVFRMVGIATRWRLLLVRKCIKCLYNICSLINFQCLLCFEASLGNRVISKNVMLLIIAPPCGWISQDLIHSLLTQICQFS